MRGLDGHEKGQGSLQQLRGGKIADFGGLKGIFEAVFVYAYAYAFAWLLRFTFFAKDVKILRNI
jgi:hypothetical protein